MRNKFVRRGGALLGLALMATVLAGPTLTKARPAHGNAARGPSISRVQAQRALDYWTPKRMANAKPMDVGLAPGGGSANQPFATVPGGPGFGSLTQGSQPQTVITSEDFWQTSTTQMPARAVGRLFMRAWDSARGVRYDSSCTATVVAAGNKATVWTAGHCVYNTYSNVYSNNYVFCPGYRDTNSTPWQNADCPLGKWSVKFHNTTPQWRNAVCTLGTRGYTCTHAEFSGDFGALTIYPRSGTRIQNSIGSHIIRYNTQSSDVYSFGYPADPNDWYPFTGQYLYLCIATSTYYPGASKEARIPCHASGGASGGPWLGPWNTEGRSHLNSVNSHGGVDVMEAPFQGAWAQTLFNDMKNQDPL